MPLKILVVGAGELGLAVLDALFRHPAHVPEDQIAVLLRPSTITSSHPDKQSTLAHIRALGGTVEAGDFIDAPQDLVPVFARYDVVIQCAGYGMAAGTQLRVTRAVLEARTPRYLPWQFGVDYEAIGAGSAQEQFDEMLAVRELLRAQKGTAWTVVSTGLFMSYLFLPEFGAVDLQSHTVRALGSWGNKVTVTQPRDIGTMVAEVVYVPGGEETLDRVVYIGGDTISYGRLADLMDRAFETEFIRDEWNDHYLKAEMEERPDDAWVKYQNIFGGGIGVSWDKERTLNFQRQIPLTDVEAYVQERK